MDKAESFTAAEIGDALNITPRAARKALADIPADGVRIIRGQETKAWHLASLPAALRERLESIRQAKRGDTIADVLKSRVARYFPTDPAGRAIPLAEIAQEDIDHARLLQKALARTLSHPEWRGAELESAGLEDYRRAFGRTVSASHWAKLFRRTADRDAGLGEWHRIELFLPENPRRMSAAVLAAPSAMSLELLEEALGAVDRPAQASVAEKDWVWLRACDQLAALLETCADDGAGEIMEKRGKREILTRLQRAGCVGIEKGALKRQLNRKWAAYCEADGKPAAVLDKRNAANQQRRVELPPEDRKIIIAGIVDCEGRASQGWRETYQRGALSAETTLRFVENPAHKSYVPASIRRDVVLDARKAVEARRRPRNTILNGAYIPRDPAGLFAGDSYCADDCTAPVYYWEPDAAVPCGFRVMRGQFIPMMCERSWLVLSFALHSERNYNSRVIRSLITKAHDDWGLPRRRFRFEKGIWKSSKILKGDELDTTHTERGLCEFGVTFSHADWAHGKMAERVLGLLQNQMERLPGYASRNEITSPNEILRKQLLEIETGKVHPRVYLKSKEEWVTILSVLIADYNKTPQQGKWCNGVSPLECWNANQHEEGRIHLGAEARYLLANHRVALTVGPKGLTLRPSLGGGLYANAHTGRLAGRKVLVWVNPDQLDFIAVTDLDRREKPVFIPRILVPAIDGADAYKIARKHVAEHNNYPRTVYKSIEPHLADQNFRQLATDRATIAMGEDMEAGMERAQVDRKRKAAVSGKVADLSRRLGVTPKAEPKHLESVARGLEIFAEAHEDNAASHNEDSGGEILAAAGGPKKNYVLKGATADLVSEKECGIYWAVWKRVEKAKPGTDRVALTRLTLGYNKSHKQFTRSEWGRMLAAFNAILGKNPL